MELTFKNLPEYLDYFKDEKSCIAHLEQSRWNGNPVCPHCGKDKPYRTATRSRKPELQGTFDFKCSSKDCKKVFTVISGTFMESTKIKSYRTWFAAIYLVTAHKKGISSLQLSRDLGITQKTAWFMLHRIRAMMGFDTTNTLKLKGEIELDETFVGGKNKNRHADKKFEGTQGRSTVDKTAVFGLMEREGQLITEVVTDTKAITLKPIVKRLVEKGALVFTDEWGAYNGLGKDFKHEVVKHNEGQYVNGRAHTNTLEGFWGLFKRGIFGIYHSASRQHLHRYLGEFTYRYNTRKTSDSNRVNIAFKRMEGRLTYNKLIGKAA